VKYKIGCKEITGRLMRDTVADLWDFVMDGFVTGSSDLQEDGMLDTKCCASKSRWDDFEFGKLLDTWRVVYLHLSGDSIPCTSGLMMLKFLEIDVCCDWRWLDETNSMEGEQECCYTLTMKLLLGSSGVQSYWMIGEDDSQWWMNVAQTQLLIHIVVEERP
jgi:hypothetical protein